MTKKLLASENQEQRALVRWLKMHNRLRKCFCKNNNEGKRTAAQGHNLQLMGLRAGVSDLFIYYPTRQYHGLWLEVKQNRKYTPSEMRKDTWVAQAEFIDTVKKLGYAGEFCFGWEDGRNIIERYLLT